MLQEKELKHLISKEIIERLKLKDEKAFNEVYYEYHRLVFSVIFNIVKEITNAEDIEQDVFIEIFNNASSYKGGNFKYWCLGIAKHKSYDFMRKKIHDEKKYKEWSLHQSLLDSNNDYDTLVDKEDEFINKVKSILDEKEYRIIDLHYNFDMKYKDIAKLLETTTSTVTSIASRAIKKLRSVFKDEKF
jgi:RNA polymerase sigma-70 factor (ECF subfamily)